MEDLSFVIGNGKIRKDAFLYMLDEVKDILKPWLKNQKNYRKILPLQEFCAKREKRDKALSIKEIFAQSEQIRTNPQKTNKIVDYYIFGNRLHFDDKLGTLDIIMTNNTEYLDKARYELGLKNPLLYHLNMRYQKKTDELGNIIYMPHKNFDKTYYKNLETKTAQIIKDIFYPWEDL